MMKLLYLILAALNGGMAVWLALVLRKNWRYLHTNLKVADVIVIACNVALCAVHLVRVFAG